MDDTADKVRPFWSLTLPVWGDFPILSPSEQDRRTEGGGAAVKVRSV